MGSLHSRAAGKEIPFRPAVDFAEEKSLVSAGRCLFSGHRIPDIKRGNRGRHSGGNDLLNVLHEIGAEPERTHGRPVPLKP